MRLGENMKIIVMVQYVGHVVHAGGSVNYRAVEIELTDEQSKRLKLQEDEHYGSIAISDDDV